jgi:hypothetical protein
MMSTTSAQQRVNDMPQLHLVSPSEDEFWQCHEELSEPSPFVHRLRSLTLDDIGDEDEYTHVYASPPEEGTIPKRTIAELDAVRKFIHDERRSFCNDSSFSTARRNVLFAQGENVMTGSVNDVEL